MGAMLYPAKLDVFIRRLFHINSFAASAALAEVCALLSAVLVFEFIACDRN